MSAFELYPTEQATKLESGSPLDLNEPPGVFDGSLSAPFSGVAKGLLAEPARVLNLALSHVPAAVDEAFGTHTRDWWMENMVNDRLVRRFTPNPRETGVVAQMLHGLFDIGSEAVVGGPMMVGAVKSIGGALRQVDEGVDAATALRVGTIEGATAALGVAIPISIAPITSKIPALLQQVGYGVTANVALGSAQRGLTHEVLDRAGYHDMAEQYKVLDEKALMSDIILGVAFGGLGHLIQSHGAKLPLIRPSDIDASLTQLNADHLEIGTAPGIPRTPEARDAHVEAVVKATEDLMQDRPVDVAQQLKQSDFEPNPAIDKVREQIVGEQQKVADSLPEAPAVEAPKPEQIAHSPEEINAALDSEKIVATPENVATVDLIARAREVDAAAVDAMPDKMPDAEYLNRLQEIVNAKQKTEGINQGGAETVPGQGPGAGGRAEPRPADQAAGEAAGREAAGVKPTGETAGPIEAADLKAADQVITEHPDMPVMLEDGTQMTAREVMARADEVVSQAQKEATAFEAAVNCALRMGE